MLMDDLKRLPNPTYQEQNIIHFLIENPKAVDKASAGDLADLTYTSTSTVVRLCKKVGMKGYPDFKMRWVQELYLIDSQISIDTSKDLIQKNYTLTSIIDIMPKVYNKVIYETNRLIDKVQLQKALRLISESSIINIYGSSVNYEAAKTASYNFSTLGFTTHAFHSNNSQYINNVAKRHGNKIVSIIISHSGQNEEMLRVYKNLKKMNIPCIILTGNECSPLAKNAECLLKLYCTDNILSLSNITYKISLTYIFDILYYALFSTDFDFQIQNALKNLVMDIE